MKVRELEGIGPASIPEEVRQSSQPLVLRGLVADWPCLQSARGGDTAIIDYLRRYCRDQEVIAFRGAPEIGGRFFYNDDFSGFNFDRITTTFSSMFDLFESLEGSDRDPSAYIGSTSVDQGFPGFRVDNDLALSREKPLVSIWMGNRTRIAAHFDNPRNIACVVAGRRRFTLFPPDQLANLYVGPLDFTPAGQAISLVDFQEPDFERFPRFRAALACAQVAELDPGDAIFIPSLWWHHVEALAPFNVLINYWWRSAPAIMGAPADALIHALLSLRGLPPEQKQAWREMFDYYVFSDDEGLYAHIPEDRRGVLGKLDEATVRQLRAMLRSKLGN